MNSNELQNRISWLLESTISTLHKLAEMKNGHLSNGVKELCQSLLKCQDLFAEENCCNGCNHSCNISADGDCKTELKGFKSPCTNCNTLYGECSKEKLYRALTIIEQLSKVQSKDSFSKDCQNFLKKEKVFTEFPYCKTWKMLWQKVDSSLKMLNQFLKKTGKVDKDFKQDRRMWQRMILSLDTESLQTIFKSNIVENASNEEDTETKDETELTEEEQRANWTYEALEELIKANDARKIRALYNYVPYPVDLFAKHDKTLAYVAVEANSIDVMKIFIDHGFDALELVCGKNVFHYAAEFGHLEILKDLVSYQPDGGVNLCENNNTPLYYACANNHLDVVDFLLQQPSYMQIKDYFHQALIVACENGSVDCTERMLQNRHCNVNGKNVSTGNVALHVASENGHEECVRILLQHPKCDVNIKKSEVNATSLYLACLNGHVECVKYLVRHPYSDINLKNGKWEENTSLTIATENGNLECLKVLLRQRKLAVNEWDSDGKTALMSACENGMVEAVRMILQHPNCDVNSRAKSGRTALSYSVKHPECMKLLLEEPTCDVNIQDNGGETALHTACFFTNAESVRLLLQRKEIDIDIKSCTGRNALRQAYGDSEINRLFDEFEENNK